MDVSAAMNHGCPQPELLTNAGLQYWGQLHTFTVNAPAAAAAATIAICKYLLASMWSGAQLAGAASYKTAAVVLAPLGESLTA